MMTLPRQRLWNKNRARSTLATMSFVNNYDFLTYARSYWVEHYNVAVKDEELREAAQQLLLLEAG